MAIVFLRYLLNNVLMILQPWRAALILLLTQSLSAHAHVKWFTRETEKDPQQLADLNTPSFWFLLALSVFTIAAFAVADRALEKWPPFKRFGSYLESYADNATLILRVFTGAALLLSWQADSMIAPELKVPTDSAGWFQFFLALLLLTARTTPLAGAGMIGLYFYSMAHYGFLHMLDYLVYVAIGYFLLVGETTRRKIAQTKVPALYIGLGFSLCWAALEKLFFPEWGLDILKQQPELTMGLPHAFFLMASAFVELSLGYLLIIGLLQRPLALTITAVFITTSAFFGKTEVVGHTILHGALLAIVVLGPGTYYPAPIEMHKRLPYRAAFAGVNFLLVVGVLGLLYNWMAR